MGKVIIEGAGLGKGESSDKLSLCFVNAKLSTSDSPKVKDRQRWFRVHVQLVLLFH